MARAAWVGAAAALLLSACGAAGGSSRGGAADLRVAASVYPLAFVVREVAGRHARVVDLTPPGGEPHELELTPEQVVEASEADLLFYVGQGFQPAVEQLAADLGERAVDVLHAVDLVRGTQAADAGPGLGGAGADPHVWLDPLRLAEVVGLVAERVARAEPERAPWFRARARALIGRLEALHRDFAEGLRRCVSRAIVTSHTAFSYLAGRYGLSQVGIAGLDPHGEPSPRRLAEVAEFARRNSVRVVFFERILSPRIAEVVADEAGIDTAVLDPLESPPSGTDYLGAMRANLRSLRAALGCR